MTQIEERLAAALRAAEQFMDVGVDRGPAIDGWQNTRELIASALAEYDTSTPSPATGSAVPAVTVAPSPVGEGQLPPIEFNDIYKDRAYIPLPGGWEIQTKGVGSSFRICNTKTNDRLNVSPQPYVYEMLEQMAREIHSAWNALAAQAPKPASAGGDPRDTALGLMKERAQKLHKMVYDLCWKYPNVPEFCDSGVLHDAIHDVLRVDTPTAIAAEADTAKPIGQPSNPISLLDAAISPPRKFDKAQAEIDLAVAGFRVCPTCGNTPPAADRLAQTVTDATDEHPVLDVYDEMLDAMYRAGKRIGDGTIYDLAMRFRDRIEAALRAREAAPAQEDKRSIHSCDDPLCVSCGTGYRQSAAPRAGE